MKILRILTTIFLALLAGIGFSAATGAPLAWTFGGLLLFSFIIPKQDGVLNVSLFDLAAPSTGNAGAGGGIDSEIILIPDENIDWPNFPSRTVNGSTIGTTIPLKAGKYMHRFYATQGTIKPTQKKVNGANKDCGGFEVGVECFHPGLNAEIIGWLDSFSFPFKGLIIIQNCADSKKYLFGEACNLMYLKDTDTQWGEEVDKEKGNKLVFSGKQSRPFAIYTGSLTYDPGSTSW
jgi:hypothetical protein